MRMNTKLSLNRLRTRNAEKGMFVTGPRTVEVIEPMAERVGFEPTLEFPLNTLSKRAPSATRPSLR